LMKSAKNQGLVGYPALLMNKINHAFRAAQFSLDEVKGFTKKVHEKIREDQ